MLSNSTAGDVVYECVEEYQARQVTVESSHDSPSDIAVQVNSAYKATI